MYCAVRGTARLAASSGTALLELSGHSWCTLSFQFSDKARVTEAAKRTAAWVSCVFLCVCCVLLLLLLCWLCVSCVKHRTDPETLNCSHCH